jgi:hypothetical protein
MRFQNDAGLNAAFADRGPLTVAVNQTGRTSGATRNRVGIVKTVTVTQEMAGDIPEQTSLVGGAVSARAKLEIDGAADGAPQPFQRESRLDWLGSKTVVRAGYDADPLDVFTGNVRELGTSEFAHTRHATLVDLSDGMRGEVTLKPFGSYAPKAPPLRLARYPTNAAAVIVSALHANGIRVTAKPLDGAVISVPMVFGALADTGWTVPSGSGVPEATNWLTTTAKFAMTPIRMTTGVFNVRAYPSTVNQWNTTGTTALRMEAWLDPRAAASETQMLKLTLAGTTVTAMASQGTFWARLTTPTGATLGGNSYVLSDWTHVALDVTAAGVFTTWINGVRRETVDWGRPLVGGPAADLWVDLMPGRVQQLSVAEWASLPGNPDPQTNFKPEADVDRALLDLDVVPTVEGRVGWELCKEIASAELGMVGFNESGRFYFKNRDTLNGQKVPVATWDTDLVDDLAGSAVVDSVRTRVTGTCVPRWFVGSGRGAETPESTAEPVAMAETVPEVGANTTFLLTASEPWMADSGKFTVITSPGQAWDVDLGIVFCQDPGGVTRLTTNLIDAYLIPLSATTALVQIRSTYAYMAYAAWPAAWVTGDTPFGFQAGSPAVWVNGRAVRGEFSPVLVNEESGTSGWGDRTLDLGESPWRQRAKDVRTLAGNLLRDLAEPRLEINDVTVPADLRWEIGDPIKLTDWAGRVPDVTARITRIETKLSLDQETGAVGTYSLRTLVGG